MSGLRQWLLALCALASACSPDPLRPSAGRAQEIQSSAGREYFARQLGGGLEARHREMGLVTRFETGRVSSQGFDLSAAAIGCEFELLSLPRSKPRRDASRGNRVEYSGPGGFSEWYENGPAGLEQGFTLETLPDCVRSVGKLLLRLAENTGWSGELKDKGARAELHGPLGQTLNYGELYAEDALGRSIPLRLVSAQPLEIEIDARDVAAPLMIDPLVWQQAALFSEDWEDGERYWEDFVGVSGEIAVVGAEGANISDGFEEIWPGTAAVFVRSGSSWSEQATLVAPDAGHNELFGYAGAVSGDTVVVGSLADREWEGSAYVFTRSGTTWTEGQKLTGSDGIEDDEFSISIALDGDTAVVGAELGEDGLGKAYVFVRSGNTWSEQQKLTASDGAVDESFNDKFGYSVAVSGDTAIIAAPDHESIGSAYVFVRSGTIWSETQQLRGAGATSFGESVAISGDTAVASSLEGTGATYVFVRSGSTFTETQKLTAVAGVAGDDFGYSQALEGDNLLVGATNAEAFFGAAYVFARSGGTFSEVLKLTAQDGVGAARVALSGNIALAGANDRAYAFTFGLDPGSGCGLERECASSYCVDGICCDAPCAGGCESCLAVNKASGPDGECGPVVVNTDPRNSCNQDGIGSCFTGSCDGGGACGEYATGTECAPAACPTETSANAADICDASAACVVTAVVGCEPGYRCIAGTCTTSCNEDQDCASDAYCTAEGECAMRVEEGSECEQANQCLSGHCVDGLCCNAACDGQCEACAEDGTEGKCVAVQGAPRGGRPVCPAGDASEPCQEAWCDGAVRNECLAFAGSDVICAQPACTEEGATPAARCDGAGSCVLPEPVPCGSYECGADACKTSCGSDSDCVGGARCDAGQCRKTSQCSGDGADLVDTEGRVSRCSPFRCRDGQCLTVCESSSDCANDRVCDRTSGQCQQLNATPQAASDEGCGCRAAPRGHQPSVWAFALALLGLSLRRRDVAGGGAAAAAPVRAALRR